MEAPRCTVAIALAALAASAGPATSGTGSEPLTDLLAKARAARLAGDVAAWFDQGRAALRLAPEHPDLHISVARAAAARGSIEDVRTHLSEAVRRGAGFEAPDFAELAALRNEPSLAPILASARANAVPLERGRVFATIEDAGLRPEGIAADAATARLFIGSVRGEIWQIDAQGRARPFVREGQGLSEVYGLEVDPHRRLLWVVTGVFPNAMQPDAPQKPDAGRTGLQAFHLDTAEKRGEYWLDERPKIRAFNDLSIARSGEVLVTDSIGNAVYRLRPGSSRLERLVEDDRLTFPNGIALSEDERHVYVAHVEGISRIDLSNGSRTRLPVPPDVSVNSIDGLVRDGRSLLGIQSSPFLSRVVRIDLTPEGQAITSAAVLSSRTPRGLAQTTLVAMSGALYVIAGTAQVNLQSTTTPGPPVHPAVLRIEL